MIEKAYAKIHTLRFSSSAISDDDMGGWEAIGGGGKVEDALADLTGGVAGRFNTKVPAEWWLKIGNGLKWHLMPFLMHLQFRQDLVRVAKF